MKQEVSRVGVQSRPARKNEGNIRMTIPDPAHAQGRQPERFGPDVRALARFLATSLVEPADSLGLLQEIDRRWPGLSFRDFMGARVLAAALVMPTEGSA
jgi:hypothetical protein